MERRNAITVAAAASLTLLAGAGGIVLNSDIVGAGAHDKAGTLTPIGSVGGPPVTVYVTDPPSTANIRRSPASPTTSTTFIRPSTAVAVTSSSGSAISGGDRDADSHDDHELGDDHGYEGADDDD